MAPCQQNLNQLFGVPSRDLPAVSYCSPGTWNMMIFFPAHTFPPSKLVGTAQLWSRSSKFLPASLLLPMCLFLTLVQIQDVTIHMPSTSLLVALRCVKKASFSLGLNFGIRCLKMLRLVSLCLPSRLLSGLSSWTSCLLSYLVCLFFFFFFGLMSFLYFCLFVCLFFVLLFFLFVWASLIALLHLGYCLASAELMNKCYFNPIHLTCNFCCNSVLYL